MKNAKSFLVLFGKQMRTPAGILSEGVAKLSCGVRGAGRRGWSIFVKSGRRVFAGDLSRAADTGGCH